MNSKEYENEERWIREKAEQARESFLTFMNNVWWLSDDFIIGRHTRAICNRLTKAVEDLKKGISTYLMINAPYGHGKSDMVSRAFPAYFLGTFADMQPDVIMSSRSEYLARSFALATRNIIESNKYTCIFPGIKLLKSLNDDTTWRIDGRSGLITVAGIDGSFIGPRRDLIIFDSSFNTVEQANSKMHRDRTWEAFTRHLITRVADPCIVIVCDIRWHTDDIFGRIIKKMRTDPEFPRFERISFPARKEGKYQYLFPERFSQHWYK